jgi:hypothetical protein
VGSQEPREFARFMVAAYSKDSGGQDPHARVLFAKALLEIRQDLGAENQGLTAESCNSSSSPILTR